MDSFFPPPALSSGGGSAWAGHASAVTAGNGALQWFLLGSGSVLMRSDGTYWRPVNGSALLYQRSRTLTTPIATMTGNLAAQAFALPETLSIPIGLMFPESQLLIRARMRRTTAGGGGTFTARVQYGTNNSAADFSIDGASMTASATADFDAYTYIGFRTAASQNRGNSGALNLGATSMFAGDLSVDTAVNLSYINFGSDAAMAATEQMILIAYSVELKG